MDAQDGYDYAKGRYNLRSFSFTGKENEVIIQQHKDGSYSIEYETMKIELIGLPFKINEIEIDNVVVSFESVAFDTENNVLIVPESFTELHSIAK